MRQSPIGPDGPRRDHVSPRTTTRRSRSRWLPGLAILAALAVPAALPAQETTAPAAGASLGAASGATPLARYFPKENLLVYFEFSGTDAHQEAWSKTAAYRMLTETPLGEMLEEVAAQLLDKALSYAPGHRLNGQEIVSLLKHGLKHGMAVGWTARATQSDKHRDFVSYTMVFRDGSTKEIRALTARMMGSTFGGRKPRLDKREGRTLIVLPAAAPGLASEIKYDGDAWWSEKDDLVFSTPYPSAVDRTLAALDGKAPSAVDHPALQELSRKEGAFEPDCIAFVDAENCPKAGKQSEPFEQMVSKVGIRRVGLRWGFEGDALLQEIRIAAPKPRKPALALFDQPGFDAKSLLPLPDGVETFVQLAIDPNALLDTVAELAPEGKVKAKIDEFSEAIRSSGKIDFRKDFLGKIGPRMVLFLAPDRSAAVSGGTFGGDWLRGLSPQAGLPTHLISQTKLTLLAEVSDPKSFGRSLEGGINAINHQLAKMTEEALDKEEADSAQPGAGGGPVAEGNAGGGNTQGTAGGSRRGGGQRGGGQRGSTRKRSASQRAPHFVAMIANTGAVAVGSSLAISRQAYILQTPSDSPIRVVPEKVRPVIKLDGKYLVISVSADSADDAIKFAKKKDWQPSDDIRKAGEHLPSKMVILGVSDPREIMPPLLASLPGTLQTIINSGIAMARAQAGNAQQPGGGQGGPPGMPNRPGMMSGGPPGMGMRRGGPMMSGPEGTGAPQGGAAPGGDPAAGIPADAMVELKVDSDKLPKADTLRSRYFLSTFTVTVTDQDIRLSTREAFVTHYDLIGLAGITALALPAIQQAREAARKAQVAADEKAAAAEAPSGGPGMRGGMPGMRGGMPGMRGGPGGGRGGPGGGRRGGE